MDCSPSTTSQAWLPLSTAWATPSYSRFFPHLIRVKTIELLNTANNAHLAFIACVCLLCIAGVRLSKIECWEDAGIAAMMDGTVQAGVKALCTVS